jgi:hypothetical protein
VGDLCRQDPAQFDDLIIPGIGHFVTAQSPCAQTVVRAFLADPSKRPDTSCAAGVTIPPFD